MNSTVATIDQPQAPAKGETTKPPTFGQELGQRKLQFQAALPAHIPVERFMRVVMTAVQNNPALANADRASLWTSSAKAATDGLLPDGRESALVIYKTKSGDRWVDKVQWMPMIAGLRKKVRNSGEIVSWEAQVVHAKDMFEYELGDDPFIKHKPHMDGDPGPVIAAYSVATLKGGEKSREVMTRAQLDKVRSVSKSKDKGPWVDWFEEMCRKSVARRHSKVLPMSTDLDDLMRRDDDLYDLKGARDEARIANGDRPQSLAGRFDVLAQMPERDDAPQIVEDIDPASEGGDGGQSGPDEGGDQGGTKPARTGKTSAQCQDASEKPDPARAALLDKLRPKASKGADALRRAMAGLSDDDRALLTDDDHDVLGGLAEEADTAAAA